MGVRAGWGMAALLVLLAPACASDPAAEPREIESRSPGYAGNLEPTESASTDPETTTTRPLVLAINARRPPIEVSEALARRVADGRVDNWRALGEPAGPLTVTDRTDALTALPLDTIAVVVADAVGPAVRVIDVAGVDPLKDPAAYALQVVGPAPLPVTTMTVVGDIMLGRRVGDRAAAEGDPSYALRPMQDRLAAADLTVGNLESTLSEAGTPTQGGDSFAADPRVREGLRAAGFDAIGLANNHLGDFGNGALVETVDLLRDGGLPTFGAGPDLRTAARAVVVERHGVRFGFLGFNAIGETAEAALGQPGALSVSMPPRTGPLDTEELDRVLDAVRRLDSRVDVVTVMPHWGTQYTQRPEPIQGRVAGELVRAGADLVIGGHPHWVQGASMRGDALVVHSLGNFVFDMDSVETRAGLMLELVFWGDELRAAEFVPYRIGPDLAPRVVPIAQAQRTFELFWEFSRLGATPS